MKSSDEGCARRKIEGPSQQNTSLLLVFPDEMKFKDVHQEMQKTLHQQRADKNDGQNGKESTSKIIDVPPYVNDKFEEAHSAPSTHMFAESSSVQRPKVRCETAEEPDHRPAAARATPATPQRR